MLVPGLAMEHRRTVEVELRAVVERPLRVGGGRIDVKLFGHLLHIAEEAVLVVVYLTRLSVDCSIPDH